MKKNNKGFSLVELIVVVLIMAIIATALTLAVTKYVAKSKRSSDANTAGELKTAAETTVTDYLTSVDAINVADGKVGTITLSANGGDAWTEPTVSDTTIQKDKFLEIFTQAAGKNAPQSKVHPDDGFVVTIKVLPNESATYEVNYIKTANSTDIFAAATK